jgi:nicotinamidase-related amidase
MAELLLVVDVQRGFLNEFTSHIPSRVVRLIQSGRYDPVLFTRFVNSPGGPYHRFLDWHACVGPPETDLAAELSPFAPAESVFTKPGYAGISEALAEHLREQRIERVTIVGIDTDMCVLKVAMDIFDLAIKPIILIDCCASTAGLQAHFAGLAVLCRNIGAEQLHDAGLSEGRIAAP